LYGAFSVNADFRFCAPVIGAHLQASVERSSRARRRLQTSGGGTTKRSERSLPSGADHRATTLYSVGPSGPDRDAVMRIGGEAPGRRAHSRNRCQHHGLLRVTATSDRDRIPTVSGSSAPSLSCPISFLTPLAIRRRLEPRHWSPGAIRQLLTCVPGPRSLFCVFCQRLQFVSDTTGLMHYLSGSSKSAKPTGSSRGVLVRCPPWRVLFPAACCRSRPVRR
jgi:hypothetical protein